MRKWRVEFLSKSQSRVIKIAQVNSIRMTNLSIYFNFLCAIPRDDVIESTRFLIRPPVNHSTMVEPVTLSKCVAEYEQMWKCIWSNFSASFKLVALKSTELIRFALPNKWFSPISYMPLRHEWRHHELSFSFALSLRLLPLVYIHF